MKSSWAKLIRSAILRARYDLDHVLIATEVGPELWGRAYFRTYYEWQRHSEDCKRSRPGNYREVCVCL